MFSDPPNFSESKFFNLIRFLSLSEPYRQNISLLLCVETHQKVTVVGGGMWCCRTSDLGLRQEDYYVFRLSQEQEEEEPSPKSTRTKCNTDLEFGT